MFCCFTLTRQHKKKTTQVEISGSVLVDVNDQEAISKIENGQSENGNGEWERGMGTGNGNGERGMGMGNILKGGISKRGNY